MANVKSNNNGKVKVIFSDGAAIANTPFSALKNLIPAAPEPAAAPPAPKAPKAADPIAALQAAIEAAKAEKARREFEAKQREEEEARARREAEAEALREAAELARGKQEDEAVQRKLAALDAEVSEVKASIEEAEADYNKKVGIIKASLKEAKALGDFISAEVISGAQDMLKALEDEYRAEIAGLNRRAKAIEGEMAQRRRNAAANPAIVGYRRFVARTDAEAKKMLAQSSRANNAGDFQKATGILEAILGDEWASDSIRARAEKALDAVRYNRRRHEEKKAAIAEQKRRRQQAAWFTAAEKAAYKGDFIVSLGRGQFAHLRPGKTAKGATFYKVVSALGYDAPAQYGNLPKRARRRDWRKGFTPRSIQKELAAAKKKLASVPSRFDADAVKAAWREAQVREAVMRLRVTVGGKAAGVTDDSFAAYGRAFAALLAGGCDIRVEESAAMGETLAEITRDDDPNFPVIIVTARLRRKDASEQRRLRAEKLARDAQAELA